MFPFFWRKGKKRYIFAVIKLYFAKYQSNETNKLFLVFDSFDGRLLEG